MKYAKKVIIADPLESDLDQAVERVAKQNMSDVRKIALYQDIFSRFQKRKNASRVPQSLEYVTTKQLEILEKLSQIMRRVGVEHSIHRTPSLTIHDTVWYKTYI